MKKRGLTMLVQSTKDYGSDRIKLLVYADSGIGKTTLASTLKDVCVISSESGLLSLSDKAIDVIDTTMNDKREVIPRGQRDERLLEAYAYLQTEEAKKKYKTIFIDSLSEICDNLVEKYQAKYPEKKDSFNLWGDVAKSMASVIRAFRDLPHYNVVMTALETKDKDENGRFFTGPLIKPKSFAEDMPKFFDYVFNMQVQMKEDKSVTRKLITQPTDTIRAKSRTTKDMQLGSVEDANLSLVFEKIKGNQTNNNQKQGVK
jgi:hypothetical protein